MTDTKMTDIILESISDGVFTINSDWKITSFNRAAEKITGIDRKSAIGQNCFEVFKSNMCESACPLRHTMETGKQLVNRTGFCVNAEGKRIPISVSTALLVDTDGTVLGGAETFRDMSELEQLKKELEGRSSSQLFGSKSPSMEKISAMLPAVSESLASVLIVGETGTGKEILARTIHELSPRKAKPFVAVNCGALPETLLESELFGYRKGAFTGADKDKPGRFALAEGGTLFLDEIGELAQTMQVKLLRVLQEHEYEPLGAVKPVKTDIRLICATNRDLKIMMAEGSFRQDLYYRINVITLDLPPLRERKEDIPDLATAFLKSYATRTRKEYLGFASEVFQAFYAYEWPGNIRELENVVERAAVLSSGVQSDAGIIIGTEYLPPEISIAARHDTSTTDSGSTGSVPIRSVRDDAERECILNALDAHSWKRMETASALGMDKATLYRKMKRLRISANT